MDIADHTQIGKPKHPGPRVEIDGNDLLRFFHARRVFIGTRDAAVDDQSGGDILAGLPDLAFVGQDAPVDDGPGAAHRSADGPGQCMDDIKGVSFADAPASGHDDIGLFQVQVFGRGFDHLHGAGFQVVRPDPVTGH